MTTAWTDLMENDREALRDRVGDLGTGAMRRSYLFFFFVYRRIRIWRKQSVSTLTLHLLDCRAFYNPALLVARVIPACASGSKNLTNLALFFNISKRSLKMEK